MSTSSPDDKTAASDPATSPPPDGQAHGGIPFDDYKKKLEARLAELGKQMEVLKDLLSKAAHDAKATLEHQLEKLQKDHSEEFERLARLRAAGEASLGTLGARLDKLVEDVTAAITAALGGAKPTDPAKSEPAAKSPADPAEKTPPTSDK